MTGLLLVCLAANSCASGQGFDQQLSNIIKPYKLGLVHWEFYAIKSVLGRNETTNNDIDAVTKYFTATRRLRSLESEVQAIKGGNRTGNLNSLNAEIGRLQEQTNSLQTTVEIVLEHQIRVVLAEQGIFNPIDKYLRLKVSFPPTTFLLEDPPHLLVVSPRDRIESIRRIMLQQNLSTEEMESIESSVDELNVSSLVMDLGGLSTLPSFVTNKGDLRFTLDTASEEWVHKYLTFKPLGFKYLLDICGISRNYDVVTMNETVAGMVSKEIGDIVYQKYYGQEETQPEPTVTGFDFNLAMREIRRAVDVYLAKGEIEEAEEFMEQKRQYLAENGYHLRKLNQAYFAFHGTYADEPTSISPIGAELKQLRNQSPSLKEFLETAAVMTSRQDLKNSVR